MMLPVIASRLEILREYRSLFLRWNDKINLSAARTEAEIDEHIRDCIVVVPHLRSAQTVLDIGSGGGLPVVVAAIELPDVRFTALEPIHKKHAFLRTVIRELALENLDAHCERHEHHALRDYDAAMSRATFDLNEWLTIGASFVRPGGLILGFEATARSDLPTDITRESYELGGKQRSLVLWRSRQS